MIRTSVFRPIISGLFLALALAQTAPSVAAQQDLDMLQAYVGSWKGFGNMGTGESEETVGCKLTVTSARPDRVTFNGQCALAGGAVKLYGTMGYIEEKNRFEAVLNSSSSLFQDKVAIGRRSGSGIVFTMRPTNPDTNAELDISVDMSLKGGKITVDAKVTDTSSGNSTTAKVPLDKIS